MRRSGARSGERASEDHRPRVARQRRAQTEARIIESALAVFAEKGPDAARIDDFIRAAGIARGTFYNYYRSTQELLEAASHALEDAAILSITAELERLDDPLERLATGMLLWLSKAQHDPLWCRFIVRVRRRAPGVERELGNDVRAAMKAGLIRIGDAQVGRDLVVGSILEAMNRMIGERVPARYSREVVRAILLGLGAERRRVTALVDDERQRAPRRGPATSRSKARVR